MRRPLTTKDCVTSSFVLLLYVTSQLAHSASFQTFLDDDSGFITALGPGSTLVQTEDFSSAIDGQPVAAENAPPDVWNGFTAQIIGTGQSPWGGSHYCSDLSAGTCLYWNGSTPATPGLYGAFNGEQIGISIKPTLPNVTGFSFDFVDWNDGGQRSDFVIIASDGTSTAVSGPINPGGAPPQTFGVALSQSDIDAGISIVDIRWVGTQNNSEIVGFYNFRVYAMQQTTTASVPTLPPWSLITLLALVIPLLKLRLPSSPGHKE